MSAARAAAGRLAAGLLLLLLPETLDPAWTLACSPIALAAGAPTLAILNPSNADVLPAF